MDRRRSEVQLLRALLLSILAVLLAMPASAAELLIIQSHTSPLYDQTVHQLKNNCAGKSHTYVMSDYTEFDLGRIVREEQPRLVIAVGDRPLKESRKLRNTAVVYAMSLTAVEKKQQENITGVSLYASPEHYLKLFRKLNLHRAGVVYNKAQSGAYLERARKIASGYGVELVAVPVGSPNEVEVALARLKASDIDALWMLPDTTAVTAETINAYFFLAQNANLPVISFSRAYLEKGALAAFEASRRKMTGQLCDSITRVLRGTDPADIPVSDIAEAALYTNETVARRLGIPLSGLEQLYRSSRN